MTRFKRRLLVGTGLVMLVLLGVGGWLYYAVFVSTDSALQRAEAFLFRRMTVTELSAQGVYRFFFVTNRRPGTSDGPLEERFGAEREEMLKFGSFDTEIRPTLGLGMIVDPSEWFENEEIKLRDVKALDQAAFVEQLRGLVHKSPRRSLLVIVHGFREAFPSALRRTAFVGHILDINSPVMLFDWPGNQGSSLAGYRRAHQIAQASGSELARTLDLITREIKPERLWLLANSMGAQVVADAFHVLYRDEGWADEEWELEDVVLTAPDVDHEEFNHQFKDEISAIARDLTVYVSSNDRALLMSRIVNRGRRLGESTVNTINPDQYDTAAKVLQLVDPDSERIALVDVTAVNRTRNFHNFSLETPEFFDDLFLRLVNRKTPLSRPGHRIETPAGSVYWVLVRAR